MRLRRLVAPHLVSVPRSSYEDGGKDHRELVDRQHERPCRRLIS
jgi:hypothetical protein